MMWFTPCVFVVLLAVVQSASVQKEFYRDITRAVFAKSEHFLSSSYISGVVQHMELDLYKNDGSILFVDGAYLKTTDGKTTSTALSGFSSITGFKQLNSTQVAVVDTGHACIRIGSRETKGNIRVIGTCGSAGYANGKAPKFNGPFSIELDIRNPGYLLVTDHNNRALRSIEIATGFTTTVVTGFAGPRGMSWHNDRLLVNNHHYISEVKWDNQTASNTKIAGSTSAGFVDGDFGVVRFNTPHEIHQIQNGLYLTADYGNSKLRLVDTYGNRLGPVCIASSTPCTTSSPSYGTIASILKTDKAVYIGGSRYIYKFTGYQCYAKNMTVYVTPYRERANVILDSNDVGVFPPGEYQFKRKYGTDSCVFYVNVFDSPIVRTTVFRSEYDVTCSTVENHISKAFLQSILSHRSKELQKLCGKDCQMSSRLQPWHTCEKDILTVNWPTDTVYPVDMKATPETFSSPLKKKLASSPLRNAEMVILSHLPPYVPSLEISLVENQSRLLKLVMPKRNDNGETVQIVLTSSCSDKSKVYSKGSDTCV